MESPDGWESTNEGRQSAIARAFVQPIFDRDVVFPI